MNNRKVSDRAARPRARRRKRFITSDRTLAFAGIAVAGGAAFFPWYVFLHQDEFGVMPMEWSRKEGFVAPAGSKVVEQVPLLASQDDSDQQELPFDPISTATVLPPAEPAPDDEPVADQQATEPEPSASGRGRFRLLHVANGRALISNDSTMFVVRVGSVLPDDSKLEAIENRDGRWVIVTSRGDTISQ